MLIAFLTDLSNEQPESILSRIRVWERPTPPPNTGEALCRDRTLVSVHMH